MPSSGPARAYAALLAIVVLWGSYPATAKLALRDISPTLLTALRCVLASAFLVAWLTRREAGALRTLTPATLRDFLILGVLGVVGSMQLAYVAIHFTTAGHAAVLQAATPVMVALAARLWLGERLAPGQWAGVAVSAAGVLIVVTDGRLAALRPEELRPGDFINLLGLAAWSGYTVYGKRVLATASPALATTGAYVLGTVILLVVATVALPYSAPPRLGSPVVWAVIVYHGLLGAIAHVGWYRAVEAVGPSRSAVFMNVQPVVGVLLAAAMLGEAIGPGVIAGGALVLLGVALTTRVRAGAAARPSPPRRDESRPGG
ncbi:MAG TPA: DMT family transporter [Candidatus Binatia bacterium]|nr:DMT family transporter [Candidatus Binatia bacterium]